MINSSGLNVTPISNYFTNTGYQSVQLNIPGFRQVHGFEMYDFLTADKQDHI